MRLVLQSQSAVPVPKRCAIAAMPLRPCRVYRLRASRLRCTSRTEDASELAALHLPTTAYAGGDGPPVVDAPLAFAPWYLRCSQIILPVLGRGAIEPA